MRIACVIKKEVTLICEKAQTDSQHILTVRLGEGEVDDVFPFKTLGKKVKAIVCIDGRPHISYEDFLLKILEILWGKEKQDLRLFKENKTKFLNFAQEVREGKFDDEARSHIDKIKKHQKKRREKDAQIAQLRIQQERDEQTLREEYLDTLSLDPNDSASLNGLAKMEVQHGNLEEAESYYQRALRVHKKDALALKGLGDIAYRREDHTKAKSYWIDAMAGLRDETMLNHLNKMLTEDLAKNPKDINILISSGNIWFYQKDLNQAKSFYDRALALDPNNVPAL
ncbi:MAG TPA: tetratricopeptide repeat protein, partial [Alphaproteobacteria bacterium]|nr:tetratricopeptide repeat protein [Alphaproteobacteria bacterium]